MVTALPRSATAWLSAWFTTEKSICWHETLMAQSPEGLFHMQHERLLGVSETSLCLYPSDQVNTLPGKKLIVHRPLKEVNASLAHLGLPTMNRTAASNLDSVEGYHMTFDALFNPSKFGIAHEWLVDYPFDEVRYDMLRRLDIQNQEAIRFCQEMMEATS